MRQYLPTADPDNSDYVYKLSSHWQADAFGMVRLKMFSENIQNLPKLKAKSSFKLKRNRMLRTLPVI